MADTPHDPRFPSEPEPRKPASSGQSRQGKRSRRPDHPEDDDAHYALADDREVADEPTADAPADLPSAADLPRPNNSSSDAPPIGMAPPAPPAEGAPEATSDAAPAEPATPAAPAQPGPAESEGDAPAGPVDEVHCHNHPETVGKWWCRVCQAPVCRECVTIHEDREVRRPVAHCSKCDTACKINKAARKRDEDDDSPFLSRLGKAAFYPLRGLNWVITLVLSLVLAFVFFMGLLFPLVPFVMLPIVGVWLVPWMYDVISESARGNRVMPNLPLPSDAWHDVGHPVLLFAAAALVCFGPAIALQWYVPMDTAAMETVQQVATPLLWVAGFVFLPIILLVVTLFESPLAIRPGLVIEALAEMRGDYLAVLISMTLLAVVASLALVVSTATALTVLVPAVIYLVATNMHLIGQLYHAHRHELAWFV